MKPDELIERYANGERQFRDADLSGTNLYGADLSGADFRYTDLTDADLYGADLRDAQLRDVDLCGADIRYANLGGANFRAANLYGANLRGALLCGADIRYANLGGANFRAANLTGTLLSGADLACARGNSKQICSTQMGKYDLVWTSEKLWIGCQSATFAEWWARTPEDIDQIESGAGKLWKEHRDFIRLMIERFPATPTKTLDREN